jgi:hypothetical protein
VTIRAELPPAETEAPPPARRRWTWRRIAALTLATMIVATAVGALVYVNTYQPIGGAGFEQGFTRGPGFRTVTDGLGSESYIILGSPGAKATVSYTLANNGPFDITLMQPPADSGGITYRWSRTTIQLPDGSGRSPTLADSHPVPFSWKSHQAIQLWVTVTKPACAADVVTRIDQLPLRWKSLGVHHLTWWKLDANAGHRNPIGTCFPTSTLRNIEHSG